MTRLPGQAYDGDDPDGYMSVAELVAFLDRYAQRHPGDIRTGVTVERIDARGDGRYLVSTDAGAWDAAAVVLASGAYNLPSVPAIAEGLKPDIAQVTAHDYKRPDQLAPGRVLVVGASATGLQLASEIVESGREVTISVAEHVRLPRSYRDRDAMWWLESLGRLDERWDEVDDLVRARSVPSPQLVGTHDGSTLDLNVLVDQGVELVGQLASLDGTRASFSGSLRNVCRLADLKANRFLKMADEWADAQGWPAVDEAFRVAPTRVPDDPRTMIDLAADGFTTVLWATGFKADYSWLDLDGVFDRKGRLRHDGGVVTAAPGIYRMGLNFLRRRKSTYIYGAETDARELVDHLDGHLKTATH
jgi:putative flavoprotein involved in K+ transport